MDVSRIAGSRTGDSVDLGLTSASNASADPRHHNGSMASRTISHMLASSSSTVSEPAGQRASIHLSERLTALSAPAYDSWATDKLLPAGSSNQAME